MQRLIVAYVRVLMEAKHPVDEEKHQASVGIWPGIPFTFAYGTTCAERSTRVRQLRIKVCVADRAKPMTHDKPILTFQAEVIRDKVPLVGSIDPL
jgi:hypothetical protein